MGHYSRVSVENNKSRARWVAEMQRELFLPGWTRPRIDSVKTLARLLLTEPTIQPFQVWLVGSMLTRPQNAGDIDLLLTRRDQKRLSVDDVEQALITARRTGLRSLSLSVDACFRNSFDDELAGKFSSDTNMITWKLEDHIMTLAIKLDLMRKFRRVGKFTVIFCRRAGNAGYYKKLPQKQSPRGTLKILPRGIRLEELA